MGTRRRELIWTSTFNTNNDSTCKKLFNVLNLKHIWLLYTHVFFSLNTLYIVILSGYVFLVYMYVCGPILSRIRLVNCSNPDFERYTLYSFNLVFWNFLESPKNDYCKIISHEFLHDKFVIISIQLNEYISYK